MEDMDFRSGLAFSLNEKEETTNSNNSFFLSTVFILGKA